MVLEIRKTLTHAQTSEQCILWHLLHSKLVVVVVVHSCEGVLPWAVQQNNHSLVTQLENGQITLAWIISSSMQILTYRH